MLKIRLIPLLLYSMLLVSCNDWLDVEPVGVQTNKTFWQTKEEVEGVLASSYIQLRKSMNTMLFWGELRGNGLKFGPNFKGVGSEEYQSDMRELNILPTNDITQYKELYKGISYANHVIKLGPGARDYDVTLTKSLLNSYLAEAVFLRSLYYFYLVRTFRDVPYITDAYDTDEAEFRVDKTSGKKILESVLADLKKYATKCKPGYEAVWQTKGRATSWACYALIADISLWLGDYAGAIEYCDKFPSGTFSLGEMEDWMDVYYPGNSSESIFELQYKHGDDGLQQNNLFSTFESGGGNLIVSDYLNDLFLSIDPSDIDVRGYNLGYLNLTKCVWKYIGTETDVTANQRSVRPQSERSPNFIFYRYADIAFIKAEALIMQSIDNMGQAYSILDETVRKRAGYRKPLPVVVYEPEKGDTDQEIAAARAKIQGDALKLIVDERLKEFYAEGKSWYDILRISRVKSVGIQYLKDCLLPHVPSNKRQIKNNDLNNVDFHYLPINDDEIRASGGILKQNPFYKKFSDKI